MNDTFKRMQDQLAPSPEAVDRLKEALAAGPAAGKAGRWKYGVAAACAALAILAVPIYQRNSGTQDLHSYVLVEQHAASGYEIQDKGGAIEHIPEFSPDYDPTVQDAVIEAPVQEEAVLAYEALMAHFDGALPDWYGGAYPNDDGTLTVLLVEGAAPGDRSLEEDILTWTGNGPVVFGSAKYSLNQLDHRMEQLEQLLVTDPQFRAVAAVCGTDERNNRLFLYLTQADEYVLAQLARLDPEDDMIQVKVGVQFCTVDVPPPCSELPAPDGDLAHHDILPEEVVSGDTDPIAPAWE